MNGLSHIASLLQFKAVNGLWHARAVGSQEWGHADSPQEAIDAALAVTSVAPVLRRRTPVERRQARFFDE